jgi:hypothetical protein
VLHVAPSGNDNGVGSAEKPFASLERARDEIRAIRKKKGIPKGGVTVLVHGGDYAVSKPFTLTAEDSGIDGAPVRYCAVPGEKAAFQGGIRLGGWKPLNDPNLYPLLPRKSIGRVWYVDMKSIGITNPMSFSGHSPAHELFVDDKAMPLARGPNAGFLHIAGVAVTNLDHGPGAYDTRPASKEGVFTYHSDLPDKWAAEPDLLLYGYWFWGWSEAYQHVESVDTNKRIITLAKPWHENGFSVDAPFYAYNALSELDAPGEWFMDRVNGRILIYPPSDIEKAAVHLSTFAAAMVKMENVSNVRFEGLTWEFGSGDAIHVNGGSNCLFAGCAIRHCAGNAIDIKGGSKHGVLSSGELSLELPEAWRQGFVDQRLVLHDAMIVTRFQTGTDTHTITSWMAEGLDLMVDQFYQHYLYTHDESFLREKAYPLIKEVLYGTCRSFRMAWRGRRGMRPNRGVAKLAILRDLMPQAFWRRL